MKGHWVEVIPTWLTAISTFAATAVAIWVLFFSPASQALVDYLHSEIAARNNRITLLEGRERELQSSISSREVELRTLATQRTQLQDQIARDQAERNELLAQMNQIKSQISQSEFAYVREEIVSFLVSRVGISIWWKIQREMDKEAGGKAWRERLWPVYLGYVKAGADQLPEKDKALGQKIVEAFIKQCGALSDIVVDVPALTFPTYSPGADYKKQESEYKAKSDALIERVFSAEQKLLSCFKGVTPAMQ